MAAIFAALDNQSGPWGVEAGGGLAASSQVRPRPLRQRQLHLQSAVCSLSACRPSSAGAYFLLASSSLPPLRRPCRAPPPGPRPQARAPGIRPRCLGPQPTRGIA
eukprot:354734-Chlamydomonas_euryale.AAC.5